MNYCDARRLPGVEEANTFNIDEIDLLQIQLYVWSPMLNFRFQLFTGISILTSRSSGSIGLIPSRCNGQPSHHNDVPLHIAIENFDAPVPIYALDPAYSTPAAIGIEVRDAAGHPLPEDEKFPNRIIWAGGEPGPRPYPRGELVPIELNLASVGWLSNRPGVYTVVVTWSPLTKTRLEPGSGPPQEDEFEAYATVHSTATFRIVAQPLPVSHSEP